MRVSEYSSGRGDVHSDPSWSPEGNYQTTLQENLGKAEAVASLDGVNSSKTTSSASWPVSRSQNVVFTDIISEGEIWGLVHGSNSVLFNNAPLNDKPTSSLNISQTSVTFVLDGSAIVTINKNGYKGVFTTPNIGNKYVIFRDAITDTGVSVSEWTSYNGVHGVSITANSEIFNQDWEESSVPITGATRPLIRLTKNGEIYFEGFIEEISGITAGYGDTVKCVPISPSMLDLEGNSTFDLSVDIPEEIDQIFTDTIDAATASMKLVNIPTDVAAGTYKADLTNQVSTSIDNPFAVFTSTIPKSSVQFRTGTKNQPILRDFTGTGLGNVSGVFSSNTRIQGPGDDSGTQYSTPPGTQTQPSFVEYAARAQILSLSGDQDLAPEIDELKILINYDSMIQRSKNTQRTYPGKVYWRFAVRVKKTSTGAWGPYKDVIGKEGYSPGDHRYIHGGSALKKHSTESESAITFEEKIDLTPFKPFYDFEVRIERYSDDDHPYAEQPYVVPQSKSDYSASTVSRLASITWIVKEPLSFPHTALARVSVSSKQFQSTPKRSYHCKGKKVLVPSNYVTRDEAADGVASYNRNVTTGSIESSYQDWDGQFRTTKVYTNNPAWVFYDLLISDRYGLGRWIDPSDVDIYSLYRVARFCDELVTDGDGGFEPRFTSNLYLTKATDAYKVLKDMATTFNSLVYWIDGQASVVADQAAEPIYNFAPSNVINGSFVYETTGTRTRANQIIVTWNNPASNYAQEALIVEDRENIIETGKIISDSAVAFGCTSEGQALRYGRWKLWTAKNQTELVNFKTGINGAFLRPGDVINVQDPFRYPGAAQYSGRVSSTGTRNQTTIPLDRAIDLQLASSYELSVLIEEPGAILVQQDPVTINGKNYSIGDFIPEDRDGNPITSKEQASNLLVDDSPNTAAIVDWKPYTRVETLAVTTSSGPDITELQVGAPGFSATPNAETVWVLREILGSSTVEGSKKEYRIISIGEDEKNITSITAVEYYNEKFTSIDEDFILSVEDPVFPYPKPSDDVPRPRNVYVHVYNSDGGTTDNDATIYWDRPIINEGSSPEEVYENVAQYAIIHNIPGIDNPLVVDKGVTSLSKVNIPEGVWSIGVITITTLNTYSWPTTTHLKVNDYINPDANRALGYVIGGISSTPFIVSSLGEGRFLDPLHYFTATGNPDEILAFDPAAYSPEIHEYIQDCSGIPQADFSSLTDAQDLEAYRYMFFDYDGQGESPADHLRLLGYKDDRDLDIQYLFDSGDGSLDYTTNWRSNTDTDPPNLSGQVSCKKGYNVVHGNGTLFTTELAVGDYIQFEDVFSQARAGLITFIVNDTDLRIDRSFPNHVGWTGDPLEETFVNYSRTLFRNDSDRDCVFAIVGNDISGQTPYTPPGESPELYRDNFTLNTEWLTVNPSYKGSNSNNHTFTDDSYGPSSLVTTSDIDNISTTFNFINSSTTTDTELLSPVDTPIQVDYIPKSSISSLGKYMGVEVTVDDGTTSITGLLDCFGNVGGGATQLKIIPTDYTGTTVTAGGLVSMQPNLFDVDNFGRIRGSSDGYAEFAKAEHLASIGIDHKPTSTTQLNVPNIVCDDIISFSLTADYPITVGQKVLATYTRLGAGDARLQDYISGVVYSYDSFTDTLQVTVKGVEGTSTSQSKPWVISILDEKLNLSRDGDLTVCGNITAFCCSDFQLKDNLLPIDNALGKIDQINGYTFEWNHRATKTGKDVGVVAQEVQKVLPEVVIQRSTGYLAVDYERIVPLLIQAIKELKKEVEDLKKWQS